MAALLPAREAPAQTLGFGPPAALNTNAASDSVSDGSPQFTTDGLGNWVAVWESSDTLGGTFGTDGDILVARSADNAATWTTPAALNTNAAMDSGGDSGPQVTTDGAGNWVAVWMSTDDLGGTIGADLDILTTRSTDNGATWTAPAALNTNAASGSESGDNEPQLATDGEGNWVAVWHSYSSLDGTIGNDPDILTARSTNDGATWTAPAALNTNAATDSGEDFNPQVAAGGAGNWVAVWQSTNTLGGPIESDWDVLVSRSANEGATWTAPAALSANSATESGELPQVTTDVAGNWVAVWHGAIGSDGDILVSRSTNNGASWSARAALNTNAATDSGSDSEPQVTTDGAGDWVAVWASTNTLGGPINTDWDILVSRSTNNGAFWSAPAKLNTNAATDSGGDTEPQVTTDAAGAWVAVWASSDTLGGTIGSDSDILFARAASFFSAGLGWARYE